MRRSSYPVAGKVVLITGAARGIGAATARELRARGARLALVGLEPERLEALAVELGPDAAAFAADVTDPVALDAAVTGAVARFGGIDVVVANAGVAPVGTVSTLDPVAWERTIAVNLTGVYRTIHTALPHVLERRGYILPIASAAAVLHLPMMSAYAASKAGVEALANVLRAEMAPRQVAVGCAYFSFIDTDMVREARDHPATQGGGGLLGGVAPLSAAVTVIADGIERRARRVYTPRWVGPLLAVRGIANPLVGRLAPLRGDVRAAIRIADENPRGPGSGPLAPPRS